VEAVNAAIPGGYAKQVPLFYLNVFNQSPVGEPDFTVPESFLKWDKWKQTPAVPAAVSMSLGSMPGDSALLPIQRKDGFPPLGAGAYHRVDVPDPLIRAITFTNDLAGKPGAHVDAMLHLADGTWKLADWSGNETTTLCRDRADENVTDLIIVSTNAGTSPLANFAHTVHVASTCPFPKRFTGSWTRTYTWPSRGSWTETIKGTATFVRNPVFPPEADAISQVPYLLESSSATWTVSGSQHVPPDNCLVTFTGQGSEPPTAGGNSTSGTTDLGLENVNGHAGAPNPEPQPFYYSIDATVDPVPTYRVTDCHGNTQDEGILQRYVEIGHHGVFDPDVPQSQIAKTADPRLLEGHRSGTLDDSPDITYEDSWSFTGSD
jgi:hypothetical protein